MGLSATDAVKATSRRCCRMSSDRQRTQIRAGTTSRVSDSARPEVALPKSSSGAGLHLITRQRYRCSNTAPSARAGSHGIGRLRTFEQTGGWGTRDQRNHGEGAPRQSDEKNGGPNLFFRADSVVLAISAEKDGNLRAVYARIGRCQGRPAWRGAQAAVARPYPAVTCHVGVNGGLYVFEHQRAATVTRHATRSC